MKNKFSIALSLAVILSMLFTSLVFADGTPTIASDLPDYAPGQTVNLYGTGWQAGEDVSISVNDSVGSSWSYSALATAAGDGTFTVSFQLPNWFVATYAVTASGTSSRVATTTFTDKVNTDLTIGFNPASPASGVTLTIQGTLTENNTLTGISGRTVVIHGPTASSTLCDAGGAGSPNNGVLVGSNTTDGSGAYSVTTTAPSPASTTTYWYRADFAGDTTYNARKVCASVTVTTDSTPPVISKTITGTAGTNGWYTSNVTVAWTVTDAQSAVVIDSGCGTQNFTSETIGTTSSCSAHSAGGPASDSVTIKIDKTKPTISAAATTSPNAAGWYDSDVTVHFTCADALSGVVACPADQPLSTEGTGVSSTAQTVTDAAGNTSDASNVVSVNIDKTKPVIAGSRLPLANLNGWNNSDVAVSFVCTDSGGSGIETNTVAGATVSAEGTGQSVPNSGSCTDKAGNVAVSATVSNINIDKTKPTLTFGAQSPVANGNGWNNTDVSFPFTAGDALSGVDTTTPASSPLVLTAEGPSVKGDVVVTDKAGNTETFTSPAVKIDKTAPSATASRTPAANTFGWNNTNVTVSFNGTDSLSDLDYCDPAVVLSTEGEGQSASGYCYDKAGNQSNKAEVTGINIDKTLPTLTFGTQSPATNGNGWNNTDVSFSFNAGDDLSGVASTNPASSPLVLTVEGPSVTGDVVVTDKAGNSATFTSPAVKIDKTAPALNILGATNGAYSVCGMPSKPTYAPFDGLSGIASQQEDWTTPVAPSIVGMYTYEATATDNAGNTASETRTYNVTYGAAFGGFLQPINLDGTSRFKLGSTIPVKFQMTCNGAPISITVAKLYVMKGDNGADPGTDEAISTSAVTTGNYFRYDTTGQQYIFNLSTKTGYLNPGSPNPTAFSEGTWTLKVLLDDGSWRSVVIQIKK